MRVKTFALIALALAAIFSFFGLLREIEKKYGAEVPAFGGTLREGVLGNPRFINPLLAQSDADRDAAMLVYGGLFRHDEDGNVVPLLAEKYDISSDGLAYTVTLKNGLRWQDGERLTVDDVISTVNLAKSPLAKSAKRASWEGVDAQKIDDRTVQFILKKAYAPFMENLTLGILPRHLWEKIPPSQISLASLNTDPVGAGPYAVSSVKHDSFGSISIIEFKANKYFAGGMPHIQNIVLKFYPSEDDAIQGMQNGTLDSYGALSPQNVAKINESAYNINKISLQRIIAAFLNQSSQKTFSSPDIRKAMNLAVDRKTIIDQILNGYGKPIDGPFPANIAGGTANTVPDAETAKNLLSKSKKNVSFSITTAQNPELIATANLLKNEWKTAGFKVDIKTFAVSDLEQSVIGPRRYDVFLYGEEIIGKNPDLFAFWHSSQRAYPGYNIALYANAKVDKLLESVRSEEDDTKRLAIYNNIQTAIKADLPAIFLFSPSYVYVTPKNLHGFDIKTISTASERFSTVQNWYLEKNYVWKNFLK